MSTNNYEPNQLKSILESLVQQKENGILSLKTQGTTNTSEKSCLFVFNDGALVFGDKKITQPPTNKELCHVLGEKFKPNYFTSALAVAGQKLSNPTSVREFIELMIRMKIFTWEDVETFILDKVVLVLEQFFPLPGEAIWTTDYDFDLSYGEDRHGLSWINIQDKLYQRQQQWSLFAPDIPHMETIPYVTSEHLIKIDEIRVKSHLVTYAHGKQTLVDIADKMGIDSLQIAKKYHNWFQNGWVSFKTKESEANQVVNAAKAKIKSIQAGIKSQAPDNTSANKNQPQEKRDLPIVLSVDDSPIIQTSIKRALKEEYNVLLASNAIQALQMLNQNQVQLLLLDLTMPDIDGLEFCQSIRKISKFHDLPIIMVTARDGLVNKMKGHIAGSNRYLTKPFQPEELREVVRQYIKSNKKSNK